MFGKVATMMTEKGIARPVSKEEMLVLLEQADRQGLVLEPQNTQDPLFVWNRRRSPRTVASDAGSV
jgi:hypothetical protein